MHIGRKWQHCRFGFWDFSEDVSKRVILTPTNVAALEINEKILDKIEGEISSYFSLDSIVSDDAEKIDRYPMEFLNSLTPSGMPPHRLNLKCGSIVMLLRNLSLKDGLCNGTRLIVRVMRPNYIDCEILTGVNRGNRHFIPRITLYRNALSVEENSISFGVVLCFNN